MNLKHLKISFLLSIIGSLVIVMFIILIKYRINMNENQIFLKTLKDNNDFYIQKEDENRIFKHNLNAKLLSIKSISNAKSKILIDDLLKENNHYSMVPDEIKVMPYGLNGIIYEKIYPYLEVLNIKIDNNIDYDIFVVLKPRRYNVLVEKLIVALDNAIEACLKSKDKALLISLFSENSSIVIEIKNTFSNNINLDNFGSKGYSTKGNKRGLGLFSVFRNNEVSLVIKIHNDLFITMISARKNY